MQRPIKLRGWDTDNEEMFYDTSPEYKFEFHNGKISVFYLDEIRFGGLIDQYEWNDVEAIVMQYTGLKDKNGKEIFEGDVLELIRMDGQLIRVVCEYGIARRGMDTGWVCDIPSFYFKRGDFLSFPIVKNYQNKHDLEIIEVIGNIYENPTLCSSNPE